MPSGDKSPFEVLNDVEEVSVLGFAVVDLNDEIHHKKVMSEDQKVVRGDQQLNRQLQCATSSFILIVTRFFTSEGVV